MADFLIREATDEDGQGIGQLIQTVFADYEGLRFEPSEHPELERPASYYADRGGRLWLVVRDGAVAGSLGLAPYWRPSEFELSTVYLDQESRGQGLASALLAGANAFASASGAERLSLWVDSRFEEGHRFYERNGFVRLPGVRALHDASDTLEYQFARDVV
jgi:putative acetyltransferase